MNYIKTIMEYTDKSFYQCILHWLKDKDLFCELLHNKNYLNSCHPSSQIECILYICDAIENDITSWRKFFTTYLTPSDLEKYFYSCLKNNEKYGLFFKQYHMKYFNEFGKQD